ncbi:hypothetical protein [Lewinella sp. W8]|uniref:hypothetical protein n=1 Tax=Lewinella sp. W8 TaxID=2528208 RepID=UPI001067FC30|nr:hypothetical protein [Lewinella sp. W8]MTB49509.1 hypothetical protein [Lewinella sp. W8]
MKIYLIAGGLALALALTYWVGVPHYAGQRLQAMLEDANRGEDSLSLAGYQFSMGLGTISLTADTIVLQRRLAGRRSAGAVERLEINGLRLLPLLTSGKIRAASLRIQTPDFRLFPAVDSLVNPKDSAASLPDVVVDSILLHSGALRLMNEEDETKILASGASLAMGDFRYPFAPARMPNAKISLDSFTLVRPHRPAYWSMKDVVLETRDSSLEVGCMRLHPREGSRQFLTQQSYKRAWTALRLDSIRVEDLPLDSLLRGGVAAFPLVTVSDLNLAVFENPALPSRPQAQQKPFPVEELRKIPFPMELALLKVNRANLNYGVLKPGTPAPDITFDRGTIRLEHLSSRPTADSLVVTGDFMFEETAPLSITFTFDQSGDGRAFFASGRLKDYALPKVNPLMEVAADASIQSGHLHELSYNFSADGSRADGELLFRYDELDLKMKGKGAWIKNIFEGIVVRNSNPRPNGDLQMGQVYYVHDPQKSFFNLYWKALVSGLQSTVQGNLFTSAELKSHEVSGRD